MFVIKTRDGQYWHVKQQIILYSTPEEARAHLEGFIEYAMNRIAAEQGRLDPFKVMEIQSEILSCQIMPIDFDLERNPNVKTIWRHEIES